MLRESDVQSLRATNSSQRDTTAGRVRAAVEAPVMGDAPAASWEGWRKKGGKRRRTPTSGSGVPAKLGLGELDHR